MKRVLSIALAMFIACSLFPLTVLAVDPTNLLGMSSGAVVLDGKNVKDFGVIILMKDNTTMEVPLIPTGFDGGGTALAAKDITQEITNNMEVKFSDTELEEVFNGGISIKHSTAEYGAKITLTGQKVKAVNGTMTIVYTDNSVNPAVVTTSAPISIKGEFVDPTINTAITSIKDIQLGSQGIYLDNQKIDPNNLDNALDPVRPGSELVLSLNTEFFQWDPDINRAYSQVRKATMENNHISVMRKVAAGSDVIKSIEIENISGNAHVVVRFEEFYDKTTPRDFDVTIYLTQRGVRSEASKIRLVGTVENFTIDVYEDYDYVFIGDGAIADAQANVRKVELDMGNEVKLVMNLTEGKKYYGRAADTLSADDQAIMSAFPVIRKAITVYSHNIKTTANDVVTMDMDRPYFVYDADGEYLGESTAKLPFRTKYYLAIEEIVLDTEVVEYDDYDDLDVVGDNPPTGGYNDMAPLYIFLGVGVIATLLGGVVVFLEKNRKINKEGK